MFFMTGLAFFMAAAAMEGEAASSREPAADLSLGRKIVDRRPVDGEGPFAAGEKVIAWTAVVGVNRGFVEHVWLRDGAEVARHYLPIGSTRRRWRTWSRHQVAVGEYTVQVLAPDGRLLNTISFTVGSPDELPGC